MQDDNTIKIDIKNIFSDYPKNISSEEIIQHKKLLREVFQQNADKVMLFSEDSYQIKLDNNIFNVQLKYPVAVFKNASYPNDVDYYVLAVPKKNEFENTEIAVHNDFTQNYEVLMHLGISHENMPQEVYQKTDSIAYPLFFKKTEINEMISYQDIKDEAEYGKKAGILESKCSAEFSGDDNKKYACIVMKKVGALNLHQHLGKIASNQESFSGVEDFYNLVSAVLYAHKTQALDNRIVSGDIKLENYCLDTIPYPVAYMVDFGCAHHENDGKTKKMFTQIYAAPEMLKKIEAEEEFTTSIATDMYALGKVLQEMMGAFGFDKVSELHEEGNKKLVALKNLAASMMNENPEARPTAENFLDSMGEFKAEYEYYAQYHEQYQYLERLREVILQSFNGMTQGYSLSEYFLNSFCISKEESKIAVHTLINNAMNELPFKENQKEGLIKNLQNIQDSLSAKVKSHADEEMQKLHGEQKNKIDNIVKKFALEKADWGNKNLQSLCVKYNKVLLGKQKELDRQIESMLQKISPEDLLRDESKRGILAQIEQKQQNFSEQASKLKNNFDGKKEKILTDAKTKDAASMPTVSSTPQAIVQNNPPVSNRSWFSSFWSPSSSLPVTRNVSASPSGPIFTGK